MVITDGKGYKLTSERAVIVSERDNNKKHHVFDTNNYYNPDTNVKISFKNGPEPYKAKFDKFKIPLFIEELEPTFDINDYSTVTAQAKFYLTDGTPWIQNWTQGNISFIDCEIGPTVEDPTIKVQDGNKEKIVLYYNLTNNNATLGLGADGKEPSGGGLDKDFTHVVIMPSGEKPMKRMPPSGAVFLCKTGVFRECKVKNRLKR